MRYRGKFIVLYMPHVVTEVELILNNLIPYLKHEYGEEVLEYFTKAAKKEASEDYWDKKNNRVVCATDMYLEEEGDNDLGIEEVRVFISNQKKRIEEVKNTSTTRLSTNKEQLEKVQ